MPTETDAPPRLADQLRELSDLDVDLELLQHEIDQRKIEASTLETRRRELNRKLIPYFQDLGEYTLVEAHGAHFMYVQGRVRSLPRLGAREVQGRRDGEPDVLPGPFGRKFPFPQEGTPGGAEFGRQAIAPAEAATDIGPGELIDGETP